MHDSKRESGLDSPASIPKPQYSESMTQFKEKLRQEGVKEEMLHDLNLSEMLYAILLGVAPDKSQSELAFKELISSPKGYTSSTREYFLTELYNLNSVCITEVAKDFNSADLISIAKTCEVLHLQLPVYQPTTTSLFSDIPPTLSTEERLSTSPPTTSGFSTLYMPPTLSTEERRYGLLILNTEHRIDKPVEYLTTNDVTTLKSLKFGPFFEILELDKLQSIELFGINNFDTMTYFDKNKESVVSVEKSLPEERGAIQVVIKDPDIEMLLVNYTEDFNRLYVYDISHELLGDIELSNPSGMFGCNIRTKKFFDTCPGLNYNRERAGNLLW